MSAANWGIWGGGGRKYFFLGAETSTKEYSLDSGFEKGCVEKSPFSRDSREFRDSREPQECGKQKRIRSWPRDSREFRDFRDSRDSSSEKAPFVMTPFSGPSFSRAKNLEIPKQTCVGVRAVGEKVRKRTAKKGRKRAKSAKTVENKRKQAKKCENDHGVFFVCSLFVHFPVAI